MFKVNQKVWCAIYGAGVVEEIRQECEVTYPILVKFNDLSLDYTADGRVYAEGNIALFPYPVEIVKATVKPSIDWSHVNENFKWLAMDADGESYLYTDKPQQGEQQWTTNLPYTPAIYFASFVPGTCDWRDSLVKRPN